MLDIKQISQIVYNAVNEAFSIYDAVTLTDMLISKINEKK